MPDTTPPTNNPLRTIGMVGAGVMGSGIAQVAAESGHTVLIYDLNTTLLDIASQNIARFVNRAAEKGRFNSDQAADILTRVKMTATLGAFDPCDLVIEAVPEHLDLKQTLFRDLEGICRRETILATNTSTLSVTSIAAGVHHRERVVGMHFFNPAPLMPLVEVVAGTGTAPEVVEATVEVARRMGKTPVRAKDTPGFIVNRVARPFYLEGLRLLAEGAADPAALDRLAREGGGFKMGPFELMDLIGLDVNYAASLSVYEQFFHAPRFRPSIDQQRMVESGRLGRKTGKGWYDYGD